MPSPPIAGTPCTPGFAAHLLISKYCDHLPQYRIEQRLKTRYGIEMSRQKLKRWNIAIAYIKEVLNRLPENPTPEEAAKLTSLKIASASQRRRKSA
jgi:transposase